MVEAAIVDERGEGALTRGPISSTITLEVTRPANYLDGVQAARVVSRVADGLGEAFRWVAATPSQPFDRISTSWECASCGARVYDPGPFSGNPSDDEEGHAVDCSRHAAEVEVWRQDTALDEE